MAAIGADHELPEFSPYTLPPTPLGTALPFELVTECLRALDADYRQWNSPTRLETMRAICLCTSAWFALGQRLLYSGVGVSLRPMAVQTTGTAKTSRSLTLLATLLARRPLARLILDLTLRVEGARPVDLLAVTSLFDDLSRLNYLEISFSDHEVSHLPSKLGFLQHANRLMLQGPMTPSLATALFSLEHSRSANLSWSARRRSRPSMPSRATRSLRYNTSRFRLRSHRSLHLSPGFCVCAL